MTKPTKLEEEIEEAIYKHDRETNKRLTNADIAKAAAEVAKRYIEKALNDTGSIFDEQQKKDWIHGWLKENGIE